MLDQVNIALWSKVDENSFGQEHDRISYSKLSSVEHDLQLQEDKTSNNSRVIKRAIRIARGFNYTDEVGFNLDSGLVNLKGGGEKEDVIVIDSDNEGNKKPPAKKYAMPPNNTTTIANPVLPNNVTNNNNNNNNNQVAASYNNVDTNQYYYQLANSQSQYGNNITWGLGTNVGVGRTSNNPAVLPNNTNNNKRNYQQMLEHYQQLEQTHQQYQRQLADINHDIDLLSRKNTRIKSPPDEERPTDTQYYQQLNIKLQERSRELAILQHSRELAILQQENEERQKKLFNIKLQDRSRELAILQHQNNAVQAASAAQGGIVPAKKQSVCPLPREKPSYVQDPPSQLHNDAIQSVAILVQQEVS